MYDAVRPTGMVLYLKIYVVVGLSTMRNKILERAVFASCSYYYHVPKSICSLLMYVA